MGTNLIVVNAGQTRIVAGRQRQTSIVITLETADAEALGAQCPSVKLASPAITKKLSTRWEDENANTNVIGITPEGFRIRNITIAPGRRFDAEEDRARRRVAVLGPTAPANLFARVDPVGLQIRIGRVPFEVIGVTRSKGMDANGVDQDDLILVPLGSAMRRLFNVDYIDTIYVQARNADVLDQAETEIRDSFASGIACATGRTTSPSRIRRRCWRPSASGPVDDAPDRQRGSDLAGGWRHRDPRRDAHRGSGADAGNRPASCAGCHTRRHSFAVSA